MFSPLLRVPEQDEAVVVVLHRSEVCVDLAGADGGVGQGQGQVVLTSVTLPKAKREFDLDPKIDTGIPSL